MTTHFDKICRACMGETMVLTPIWDVLGAGQAKTSSNSIQSSLSLPRAMMLNEFTRFDVSENDDLPKNMCLVCVNDMEQAFLFKQKCERSEIKLRECIKPMDTENRSSFLNEIENPIEIGHKADFHTTSDTIDNIEEDITIKDEQIKIEYVEDQATHQCLKCFTDFNSNEELEQHMFNEHRDQLPLDESLNQPEKISFTCGLCGADFVEKILLQQHQQTHPVLRVEIADCTRNVNESREPKKCSIRILGIPKCFCSYCKTAFVSKRELNLHIRKKHAHTKPFTCQLTTEKSKELNVLAKNHGKSSATKGTKKRSFGCENCGKMFKIKSNLKVHLMRHIENKEFKCDKCPSSFVRKYELEIHSRSHNGNRPFVCGICNRCFTTKTNLTVHILRHTQLRPFKCDDCPASFVCKPELDRHIRAHIGDRWFPCDICGRNFTKPSTYALHRHMHITGDKSFKPGKKRKCTLAIVTS